MLEEVGGCERVVATDYGRIIKALAEAEIVQGGNPMEERTPPVFCALLVSYILVLNVEGHDEGSMASSTGIIGRLAI